MDFETLHDLQIDPEYGIVVLWNGRYNVRVRMKTKYGGLIRCKFKRASFLKKFYGVIFYNGVQLPYSIFLYSWFSELCFKLANNAGISFFIINCRGYSRFEIFNGNERLIATGTVKRFQVEVNSDKLSSKMCEKQIKWSRCRRYFIQKFQFTHTGEPVPCSRPVPLFVLVFFYYWVTHTGGE